MPDKTITCLAGLLLIVVAGCSRTTPTADEMNTPPQPAPRTPETIARDVVAERADINPDAVEIISVDAVEFRDSSLDCPQPGMAYAQVITPGYVVIARAADKDFDVRVSGSRGLICDRQTGRKAKPVRTY